MRFCEGLVTVRGAKHVEVGNKLIMVLVSVERALEPIGERILGMSFRGPKP